VSTDLTRSLADHEAVIERGLDTFVEVGRALSAIRDGHLYLTGHATFEDYCQDRWGLSRKRAYDMMSAAQGVSQICDTDLPLPTRESQARELARVPKEQRAEVWRETVERTNGKPTAAAVRETYAPSPPPPLSERPVSLPPISPAEVAELRAGDHPPRVMASPAVAEVLESDGDLQQARYLHEFTKVLTRSDDFMEFDAAKLAAMADADLIRTIDDYAARVRNFTDRFHRARPGLHVINGGSR
jgi:hypothetical protein